MYRDGVGVVLSAGYTHLVHPGKRGKEGKGGGREGKGKGKERGRGKRGEGSKGRGRREEGSKGRGKEMARRIIIGNGTHTPSHISHTLTPLFSHPNTLTLPPSQIHSPVGHRIPSYYCVRDSDSVVLWRGYETYMLIMVLILPTLVMTFAYSAIGYKLTKVMIERSSLLGGTSHR